MKNRKRGFSLVELLIVLAVIAALIATITPVALNAIKKAKATQVAQNLKTLASAIENKGYVEGATGIADLTKLTDVARDISSQYEAYVIPDGSGEYTIWIVYNGTDVDVSEVSKILQDVEEAYGNVLYTVTADDEDNEAFKLTSDTAEDLKENDEIKPDNGAAYYTFDFTIY
jgi:prepilin-type N-terminal cleavage/methylation domain-containing protein